MPSSVSLQEKDLTAPTPNRPRCDMCGIQLVKSNPTDPLRCIYCFKLINDWINATSWNNLLQYNREFIRGPRDATVYSKYPLFLCPDLWPGLLRLHDYGVMVTDAAPDHWKVGEDDSVEHKGEWFEVQERAYIKVVIPTNHPHISLLWIGRLIMQLLTNEDIDVVSYYDWAAYETPSTEVKGYRVAWPSSVIGRSPNTPPLERDSSVYLTFYSSMRSSSALRTVARHRTAATEKELSGKPWQKCERNDLPVVDVDDLCRYKPGTRSFGRPCTMTISMKPVIITIASRGWPPDGANLIKILGTAVNMAGFEPLFKEGLEEWQQLLTDLAHKLTDPRNAQILISDIKWELAMERALSNTKGKQEAKREVPEPTFWELKKFSSEKFKDQMLREMKEYLKGNVTHMVKLKMDQQSLPRATDEKKVTEVTEDHIRQQLVDDMEKNLHKYLKKSMEYQMNKLLLMQMKEMRSGAAEVQAKTETVKESHDRIADAIVKHEQETVATQKAQAPQERPKAAMKSRLKDEPKAISSEQRAVRTAAAKIQGQIEEQMKNLTMDEEAKKQLNENVDNRVKGKAETKVLVTKPGNAKLNAKGKSCKRK